MLISCMRTPQAQAHPDTPLFNGSAFIIFVLLFRCVFGSGADIAGKRIVINLR